MENNFVTDVLSNPNNTQILERWDTLCLPDGWLVAGCLFQTVWNRISNQAPETGIKDYDIFYYDAADLSSKAEQTIQRKAEKVFSDLDITVELCNQARVPSGTKHTLVTHTLGFTALKKALIAS